MIVHCSRIIHAERWIEIAKDAAQIGDQQHFSPGVRPKMDLTGQHGAVAIGEVKNGLAALPERFVGGIANYRGNDISAVAALNAPVYRCSVSDETADEL